jgi:hypothetical protein
MLIHQRISASTLVQVHTTWHENAAEAQTVCTRPYHLANSSLAQNVVGLLCLVQELEFINLGTS